MGNRKRRNVTLLYGALERKLLRFSRTQLKEKTKIIVKYGKSSSNETIASLNAFYLLYASGCFLEDYMSINMQKNIRDKYLPI